MSTSSETRIVSIQFDNKDFEKNVQQSLNTLERLNRSLEFKDGSKGLQNISNAASKVDMTSLSRSVDETANHFSKLEVMGITALANITNSAVNAGKSLIRSFIEPLTKGGLERALNMEKANFMFEGLGYTVKQIGKVGQAESIMDNIYKSVEGTVYSLDRAAVLASQLMASGITGTGKNSQLTHVLKAVAGLASVYSADYERVGEIFAETKAQTVLMGGQVESLRRMGIPIYKLLGDYLNEMNNTKKYTEKEVKDMISKQKIDFQTFSDAMEAAFGEQAAKSKETFIGALEDMKAAAARIGEAFYKPIIDAGRDFYNASVPLLDSIKSRLTNEGLTGPIDKFGKAFQNMVGKVIVAMDLLSAALNFQNTKEQLEALVKNGLADKSRLDNLDKYASTIERIRTILEGLGKVASFVGGILSTAWGIISKILVLLSPVGGLLVDIGLGLAEMASALNNTLTKIQDFGSKAEQFIDALIKAVQNSTLLATISEKISSAFKGMSTVAEDFGNALVVLSERISQVVYNLTDGLFNALQRAKEGLADLVKVSDVVSTALGIVLASKFLQLGSIFNEVNADGTRVFLLFKKLKMATAASMKAASAAFYEAVLELHKTMEVFQRSLNADIIFKIAVSIGILAVSLTLLSKIDAAALMKGVTAIGALALILHTALGGFIKCIKMISTMKMKDFAAIFLVETALIRIALALLGMAMAVKVLASIDLEGAIQGIVSLKLLSMILVSTMKELSKLPKLNFLTINLTFLALAIDLLAVAFKILGTMEWNEIAKAASGMTFMAVALVVMMKKLSELSKASKPVNPASLLLIALSIDMLAVAFKLLGGMSWEQVGVAVMSMVTICTSLGILMTILGKMNAKGDALKNAGTLIALGIALGMIGKTFSKLGNMDWGQVGRAAAGLVILEFFIVSLMDILSSITAMGDVGAKLGSLAVIVLSFSVLAGAFSKLGGMSWEQLGVAAAGMAVLEAVILSMMAIMKVIGKGGGAGDIIAMAGALAILSVSILLFAAAMAVISAIPLEQLGMGMMTIALSIVLFAGLAEVLKGSVMAMIQLAAGIAAFSLSLVLLGAGFLLIGYGLQVIVGALNLLTGEIALKFAALVMTLAVLSPVFEAAGIGMLTFGAGIAAIGLGMVLIGVGLISIGAGLKMCQGALDGLVESINQFANIDFAAVDAIAELVFVFGLLSPLAVAVGIGLMSVGAGLLLVGAGIGGIAEGFLLVKKAISGIFDVIETKISSMVDKVSAKLSLMKDTITAFKDVIKALYEAMKKVVKDINDLYQKAYNSGKHVVDGVVKGISDGTSSAAAAARSLAKATLAAYKAELGISSPSKAMAEAARWTVMGFVKGVEDNQDRAVDTMSTFAQAVLSAYEYIAENADTAPTITPVLDTSLIQNGVDSIDSMMNHRRAMAISAAMGGAYLPTTMMAEGASDALGSNTTNNSTNYYNITVDGAENPEEFADRFMRRISLKARTT